MKTVEIGIYTFDELSEDAKERARDWYRESARMPDRYVYWRITRLFRQGCGQTS